VVEAKEDRGKAEITAETSGEGKVKVEGKRLQEVSRSFFIVPSPLRGMDNPDNSPHITL
jgi:hypothetical protein